jgi:hypothetical protein
MSKKEDDQGQIRAAARGEPSLVARADVVMKPREPAQFREVLARLATDTAYRASAMADPNVILEDYRLTLKELQILRQAAIMSGADTSSVNRVRVSAMRGQIADLSATDVDVSCCSCCCCCCGETSLLSA